LKHPDLVISRLATDEVAIFYAKGAKEILIYDENIPQAHIILKKLNTKNNFTGVLTSANLEVAAKLVSLGLGYGILPTRVASYYAHLERLKDAPTYKDEICLVYRPEKHNNPISKKIIQIIKGAKI